MKNTIMIAIIAVSSLTLKAQIDSTVTYYKDFEKDLKVEQKKAKFCEKKFVYENDSTHVEFSKIKTNKIYLIENYREGKRVGIWIEYSKKGILIGEYDYSKLVYSKEKINGGLYFDYKKKEPSEFVPAECESFFEYLGRNAIYPPYARDNNIQGTVLLHVKIDKEGNLTVISIYKGVHVSLDYSAVTLFEKMPKWTPSKQNGEPIDSYTIIPFVFKLS